MCVLNVNNKKKRTYVICQLMIIDTWCIMYCLVAYGRFQLRHMVTYGDPGLALALTLPLPLPEPELERLY